MERYSQSSAGRYLQNSAERYSQSSRKDTNKAQRKDTYKAQQKDTNNAQRKDTYKAQRKDTHATQRIDTHKARKKYTHEAQRKDTYKAQRKDTHGAQRKDTHGAQRKDTHKAQRKDTRKAQRKYTHKAQQKDTNNAQRKCTHNAQPNYIYKAQPNCITIGWSLTDKLAKNMQRKSDRFNVTFILIFFGMSNKFPSYHPSFPLSPAHSHTHFLYTQCEAVWLFKYNFKNWIVITRNMSKMINILYALCNKLPFILKCEHMTTQLVQCLANVVDAAPTSLDQSRICRDIRRKNYNSL